MSPEDLRALLPAVMQRAAGPGSLTAAHLGAMADLLAPAEAAIAGIDGWLDARRAPAAFVPFLAGWVDLARFAPERGSAGVRDPARLRDLAANAGWLAHRRGTAAGLLRFLRLATGLDGFALTERVDAGGRARLHHVCVRYPAAAADQLDLVRAVVETAKPAHVTYDLAAAA